MITMFRIALDSILGDWREDDAKGLPWPVWWQSPGLAQVEIEGEIRRQALPIPDLIEVRKFTATRVGEQLAIEIVIAIREDDSITLARLAAGIGEVVPGAWYLVIDNLFAPVIP